ncbi:DUF2683 family protein [Flavobacterium psychraquaticum]|uniref:DUF2683 family protein n=1 Tax=Flavobacterium psychraquaticum TaxID=3103958 RepID=UPI002ACE0226|nr:DUF2683 family protein [Flavobacterium sp. LB-N7T]
MTTITIKINEKSKKGKAFLAFARTFFTNEKDVIVTESKDEKVEVEETPYNPEFVKMVLEADKRGNYTTLDPTDIWGSLELK